MYCIMNEGYLTHGGQAGRGYECACTGLREGTGFDYLRNTHQAGGVSWQKLDEYGIPYQRPSGHAIFVDAKRFSQRFQRGVHSPNSRYRALPGAGIRSVEIGALPPNHDPDTHENRYPALELLRLAIPRRVYTNNHIGLHRCRS